MDAYWTRRNRSDAPTCMHLVTSFSVMVGGLWLHNAPAHWLGSFGLKSWADTAGVRFRSLVLRGSLSYEGNSAVQARRNQPAKANEILDTAGRSLPSLA
jgi:hypothetical protein